MTFYALRAEPGRLPVVRQLLRRQGMECYLPAEIRRNHRRNKRIIVPMMPYLFVKAPEPELQALWMQQVRATRHVKGFVAVNAMSGPHPIHDAKIEVLKRSIKDVRDVNRAKKQLSALRRGGKAVVKSGPLAGRKGTVKHTTSRMTKLEAWIFGTMRVVTVETEKLEAA